VRANSDHDQYSGLIERYRSGRIRASFVFLALAFLVGDFAVGELDVFDISLSVKDPDGFRAIRRVIFPGIELADVGLDGAPSASARSRATWKRSKGTAVATADAPPAQALAMTRLRRLRLTSIDRSWKP